MNFILSMLFILFTNSANAGNVDSSVVCMHNYDGLAYGCVKVADELSSKSCREKHKNNELEAFYLSDTCTHELSAELRGEEFEQVERVQIEVSCFTYETGSKYSCEIYDYEPAYQYCAQKYGDKYLPHHPSVSCNTKNVEMELGYVEKAKLVEGLKAKIEEAEALLTMIDRKGMKSSLQELMTNKPVIGNEFYTDVMKGLLSKLKIINAEIERRSAYKIDFAWVEAEEFRSYIVRYLSLVGRTYQVYAFVAHKNHSAIETYDFKNLDYLDLRIKRDMALEVMAKINVKATSSTFDDYVYLTESEQNKQIYEYMAISEPANKVDYAKLVAFMGIRENITNLWAVDRMSSRNLLRSNVRSCGNFLSIKRSSSIGNMAVVKENTEYDIFYNDYLERQKDLYELVKDQLYLNQSDLKDFLLKQYKENSVFQQYINDGMQSPTESRVEEILLQDSGLIVEGLLEDMRSFLNYNLRSFVLPGDNVLSKKSIAERISSEIYLRQFKTVKMFVTGLYPWMGNEAQAKMEAAIQEFSFFNLELTFKGKLNNKIQKFLGDYADKDLLSSRNYDKKVSENLAIVKEFAKHASLAVKHDRKENIKVRPTSVEELFTLFETKISKDFQDIKITLENDKELAEVLSGFFNKLTGKFNAEYLVETENQQYGLKGTDEERSQALWEVMFDVAREYYEENKFEISGLAQVPNAVMLSRDREQMSNSPYTIQVYQDGTPVALHINQFYEAFQEQINIEIPRRDIVMRSGALLGINELDDYGDRNIEDHITDGTFGRPYSYISAKGELRYENVDSEIGFESLKRLYLQSMDFTKDEIKHNLVIKRDEEKNMEEYKKEMLEDIEIIKNSQQLFARVFELFKLPMGFIANNTMMGSFNLSTEDEKYLLTNKLSQAYGQSALLKNHLETVEEFEKWVMPRRDYSQPYKMTYHEKKERTLLLKIGYHAFKDNAFDEVVATDLIKKMIKKAQDNTYGKLQKFCAANYEDYKNDDDFKDTFSASAFLRSTLKNGQGMAKTSVAKIRTLDENIRKETRTKLQGINEDYLEPGMMYLGVGLIAAMLVAGALMATAATMGTAAPAAIGGMAALLGQVVVYSNYVFLPIIIASTYSRLNTQFYEVPEQLKFQKSIAYSQIDMAKIADHDMAEEQRKENHTNKLWTIGFLPLDIWFGHSVAVQVRTTLGYTGVKNYSKLTGMKLKMYSSPPQLQGNTYKVNRRKYGLLRGSIKSAAESTRRTIHRLPRYQVMPTELIQTAPLRMGIANKFRELKLGATPWKVNDEVKQYRSMYTNRVSNYHDYLKEKAKGIANLSLVKGLKVTEVFSNGFWRYSRKGLTIASFIRSIKKGNVRDFVRRHGRLMQKLDSWQLKVVLKKTERLDLLVNKISEFKKTYKGTQANDNLIDDMLATLSDEELHLLLEVGKKTKGELLGLKKVFKLHVSLVQSLKPTVYQTAGVGENVGRYDNFLADGVDTRQIFDSDTEDIVKYYEGVMRQTYKVDMKDSKEFLDTLELKVQDLYKVNSDGTRNFL